MIRLGSRATYKATVGTIIDVSKAADNTGPYLVWHLVYDEPQQTYLPCGCHSDGHRYLGVHTVAGRLTLVEST